MKTNLLKISVLFMMALSIGCSKDGVAGTNGKDGINGINGTNGATGPAGTNGANGTNGNANVIGTNTLTSTSATWTSGANGAFWGATITEPLITQAVVDKGIVSVFISNGAGGWYALPYTMINSWSYAFALGQVALFYTSTNGNAISNPGAQTFRVVIITASNRMANPKVNWNNYNEVKAVLHLED